MFSVIILDFDGLYYILLHVTDFDCTEVCKAKDALCIQNGVFVSSLS